MPKIGLEIHQRLATHKLFCNCYANESQPSALFRRELNLAYSELSEVDVAARREHEKHLTYVYEYSPAYACLVELDEEPPKSINEEALTIALSIALAMNMKIVDAIQFMRKIVIDGSNTTGFQRTALIAVDGVFKGIPISTLCLEEESAGIVSQSDKEKRYRLDRLGIPLVEIATAPAMKNGKEAREVAESIGMLLRMTGRVMRGIGTIRQDLNVSVEGGARVEIKGAQELNLIEAWVENEIRRQKALLSIIDELKKRNAYSSLSFSSIDISHVVEGNTFVKKAIDKGAKLLALPMPKHGGILGKEISPNRRYGSELSDYAKQAGVKGLIHSDEDLSKYGIDREAAYEALGLSKEDAFIAVVGEESIAKRALLYAYERAKMDYIPKEVRKTLKNGSTAFLRPMPTSARLYPETDVPIILTSPYLLSAERIKPKPYEEVVEELQASLNRDLAVKLAKSPFLFIYKRLKPSKHSAKLLAKLLTDTYRELSLSLSEAQLYPIAKEIIALYEKGRITEKAAKVLMAEMAKGKKAEEAIKEKQLEKLTREELLNIIERYKTIKEIMAKYPLRVDAKELIALMKVKK